MRQSISKTIPRAVYKPLLGGLCVLYALGAFANPAQLPRHDLTIELRQIDEGKAAGAVYSAGSGSSTASTNWEPQMVQVANGEKASIQLNDAIPMQWVQSVNAQGSNSGAGVNYALNWFDAGQSITVLPRWGGGNQSVRVELEVKRAAVSDRVGSDLPTQTRNSVSTTITVPLAQWVTVASSGKAAPTEGGSYSSASAQQGKRLLQIRVMVP